MPPPFQGEALGGGIGTRPCSTGCAALHPWLPSYAPPGQISPDHRRQGPADCVTDPGGRAVRVPTSVRLVSRLASRM